jgi:hypothetical protein
MKILLTLVLAFGARAEAQRCAPEMAAVCVRHSLPALRAPLTAAAGEVSLFDRSEHSLPGREDALAPFGARRWTAAVC